MSRSEQNRFFLKKLLLCGALSLTGVVVSGMPCGGGVEKSREGEGRVCLYNFKLLC